MSWPYRWDLLLRYRLIEIVSHWEGRLTTNHLKDAFGIGRQQASKDINEYINTVAPGNLIYDKQLKGYKPTESFKAVVTSGTPDEYLHTLSHNKDLTSSITDLNLGFANTHILNLPSRPVDPIILRALVQASRDKRRIDIDYLSVNNPKPGGRNIVPHTLVVTPHRWHVRAYCESNQEYRDFVLSRFRGIPEFLDDTSDYGIDMDTSWNTEVTLTITPDPRLNEDQQNVIAHDYGMKNNKLAIKSKAALLHYVLQSLNINPKKLEEKPEAQQIVIENYEDIKDWL